nr:hypothetical protein [Tanacetum cinerariifolium]
RCTKRAIRIAQSKALSLYADELASLSRDDRHEEAFPTVSSLDAGQDRENIAKTSDMPYESSPRVPSLDADEGSMSLKDKESRREEPFQEDAPITGGIIDIWEELGADKSTEKGSNDTKEMVNMLSGSFPTVSAIFTTASVITPYKRRSRGITIGSLQPMRIPIISVKDKGKEKVTETKVPKKKKFQEQIDAQVAREMKEEFARENQREKIVLISELVKYQDHRAKILKYQAQKSKPLSKKEQREFYMSEDFVFMSSKNISKRVKRPGLELDQGSSKRANISYISGSEPLQEQQFKGSKGVSEEELKGMM